MIIKRGRAGKVTYLPANMDVLSEICTPKPRRRRKPKVVKCRKSKKVG